MTDLARLDGTVFAPGSPGYEANRRPANVAYHDVRPRLVVSCRSTSDVVAVVSYAAAAGEQLAVRGGGHCFAGRSSTDGIVLDLSELNDVTVAADAIATIGAGARLGQVYPALHAHGRTLPAGCGPTVGITGLTLGGGIGLLGRQYGLTCDRLVGAQVVLADGSVVNCDDAHEPKLFWALRGAGGGQFGVVTALQFATVPEPLTTRVEAWWSDVAVEQVMAAWQAWAPDAPDQLTVNLAVIAEPGEPVAVTAFGAATLPEADTHGLLREFTQLAGLPPVTELIPDMPVHRLKASFSDSGEPGRAVRIRSEFFTRPMPDDTLAALTSHLTAGPIHTTRQLSFTAMGGAYARVPVGATAFAHRGQRFLLEHTAAAGDPWVDRSWHAAHGDASGRVYPNFPDLELDDWPAAYHAENHARLVEVKNAYDPHRFFRFPQSL